MNTQIFIRNIQLYKLGLTDLDTLEKEVYDFILINLSDLLCFEDEDYPECLFLGRNSDEVIIIYYNKRTEFLYITCSVIWDFFIDKMKANRSEIKSLVQWWAKNSLGVDPTCVNFMYFDKLTMAGFNIKPVRSKTFLGI